MKRIGFSFLTKLCVAVLLCASTAALAYTPASLPPPSKTVYELMAQNKNLSKFVGMVDEAGLKQLLSATGGEPITVFASTNSALEDMPSDVMKRVKANLPNFVKYHIIAGSMVSSGAIKGRRASPATADGETLSFDGTDRTKAPKVGDGTLAQADIMATNGILHVVSGALVPPSMAQAPAPMPASPKLPAVVAEPSPPSAPVAPAAPTEPSASPAEAQPAATAESTPAAVPAAMQITTSGVAKAPGIAVKSIAPTSRAISTQGVAKAPAAVPVMGSMTTGAPTASLPATTTSSLPQTTSGSGGFELFGHKFGW